MKIKKIIIHNFRSFEHQEIYFQDYSILIGENNVGKSNIVRALRIFFDDLKFNDKLDFPNFKTKDQNTWIKMYCSLSVDEKLFWKKANKDPEYYFEDGEMVFLKVIKGMYQQDETAKKLFIDDTLYLETNKYKKNGSLIQKKDFNKSLSPSQIINFIYIPDTNLLNFIKHTEIENILEQIKLIKNQNNSGNSSLTKILEKHFIDIIADKNLSFEERFCSILILKIFLKNIKKTPYKKITEILHENLIKWNIDFEIKINSIDGYKINFEKVAYNPTLFLKENSNSTQKINSYGQGLQRMIFFILEKMFNEKEPFYFSDIINKENKKKLKRPIINLLLFEEPEAHLHYSQIKNLNQYFKDFIDADKDANQVIITSHSPIIVSENKDNFLSLINLKKKKSITEVFQFKTQTKFDELINQNNELYDFFLKILNDKNESENIKKIIRCWKLANEHDVKIKKFQEEKFKYFLYLNIEKSSLFFTKHVFLCEGHTEKIFFEYLTKNNNDWKFFDDHNIYILDTVGKFNMHRIANLLHEFGIDYFVMFDSDLKNEDESDENKVKKMLNEQIKKIILNKNSKIKICVLDKNLEFELGITSDLEKHNKPLNMILKYKKYKKNQEEYKEYFSKLNSLREKILKILPFDIKENK